ncbi:MAG: AMMECR1 domain-containing protein [Candidatus Omnitrophica bacterium 4484_70.2]|nr:MAG: AMMECR1 domain-containing protein [Candidatus Omnitrophica bacterium 4484_70.2]
MYTPQEKKFLLNIARESIKNYFKEGRPLDIKEVPFASLKEKRAVFVTLNKHHSLRGCIGRIVADLPLYKAVSLMAIEAAFRDPRFPPLREEELQEITIEISVLTPFKRITDVNQIRVGEHGLFIRKGFYSGLLLPQVATEYRWDKFTFLDHTCMKAGLSPGCWKNSDTQIFIFSATVFSEEDF